MRTAMTFVLGTALLAGCAQRPAVAPLPQRLVLGVAQSAVGEVRGVDAQVPDRRRIWAGALGQAPADRRDVRRANHATASPKGR